LELIKNEWTPCPLFSFIDEEEKVEKIFEDVEQNVLQINIHSAAYEDPNAYFYINLSKNN
jgi:hypothetical protein